VVKSARLEAVRTIVAEVRDPELPSLTIQDLGVLRDVRLDGETVVVTITPTYSGCPAMGVITEDIVAALRMHSLDSRVETVLSPAWTTDWMSEAARAKLMDAGVGAPGSRRCPNCGSDQTRSLSEYGSTACQALHTCDSCLETFPFFKTHR
jgi:ring-1,2-phenylacetyl-CoA epoxidase subunit PaaD